MQLDGGKAGIGPAVLVDPHLDELAGLDPALGLVGLAGDGLLDGAHADGSDDAAPLLVDALQLRDDALLHARRERLDGEPRPAAAGDHLELERVVLARAELVAYDAGPQAAGGAQAVAGAAAPAARSGRHAGQSSPLHCASTVAGIAGTRSSDTDRHVRAFISSSNKGPWDTLLIAYLPQAIGWAIVYPLATDRMLEPFRRRLGPPRWAKPLLDLGDLPWAESSLRVLGMAWIAMLALWVHVGLDVFY